MTIGIWILGDQLHQSQAALISAPQAPVILIESLNYARHRPYHRQKLVLVWSAMRHFAAHLKAQGRDVTYEIAEDFATPLKKWIDQHNLTELRIMQPQDRPFEQLISNLELGCQVNFIAGNHFFWTREEFQTWANSRERLVLEDFYRQGRKRFQILMEEGKPVGEKWNFDKQNRKPPKKDLQTPKPMWFEPDKITQAVIDKVKSQQLSSYGEIEPFRWGVTRPQALKVLDHFLTTCLPNFGTYQDAMITGEETMWHSLLSPYLNLGLLQPKEVITAAEIAYHKDNLPLNSVEGFIRQILGWREYLNGIYHYVADDYGEKNWFNHSQRLPDFYWDADKTQMNCLHQSLKQLERTGYAHHIQRLMILSNFALLVSVAPQEIEAWFHAAFIDGYDWVMQTNVIGMGQFADGGILASKPYVSSANYINKMSDYCGHCTYNQRSRTGDKACPFNFLYWDFLHRHREKLRSQGRMNLILGNLKRIANDELQTMRQQAQNWRR